MAKDISKIMTMFEINKITNAEIEALEKKIKENDKHLKEYRNNDYVMRTELIKLLQKECSLKIGECYINEDNDTYYKIIDIDYVQSRKAGPPYFNKYLYHALEFKYPYDKSLNPLKHTTINLAPAPFLKKYIKMSKEEYNEKFKEVNKEWQQVLLST